MIVHVLYTDDDRAFDRRVWDNGASWWGLDGGRIRKVTWLDIRREIDVIQVSENPRITLPDTIRTDATIYFGYYERLTLRDATVKQSAKSARPGRRVIEMVEIEGHDFERVISP